MSRIGSKVSGIVRDPYALPVAVLAALSAAWWVWALLHPGWDRAMRAPIEIIAFLCAAALFAAADYLATDFDTASD